MSFNECANVIGVSSLSLSNTFFDFVYGKIARDTKNRFIEKGEGYIDILPFNSEAIRVIPIWKDVNINKLDISDELTIATNLIKEGELNQVYLVYPKNEKFTKHIEIKSPVLEEFDYKIKLIPYSLNSLVKKGRKNGSRCC